MQRLNSYLHTKDTPPYILNLDPAVTHMPYSANIDIRDTVDYKEVMKQCVILVFFPHRPNRMLGRRRGPKLALTRAGTDSVQTEVFLQLSTCSPPNLIRSCLSSRNAPRLSSESRIPTTTPVGAGMKAYRYILVDTPGQIEIFTWSASGAIITDAIASSLPTVVAYIIDTPRTTSPTTFMSNMLYACS